MITMNRFLVPHKGQSIFRNHQKRHFSKVLQIGVQGAGFGGGQTKQGLEQGPDFIRASGFTQFLQDEVGHDIKDYGNISFSNSYLPEPTLTKIEGCVPLKNVANIAKANFQIYNSTLAILNDGRFPLTLGGDHSISIGTLATISENYQNLGVLWVDTHADLNTPYTTMSGNLHGLPVAFNLKELHNKIKCLTEFGWITPRIPAKNIAYIGLREFGEKFNPKGQRDTLRTLGIKAFTMADVDKLGISEVTARALEHICSDGKTPIHTSFDIDVLDDLEVGKFTGTWVSGGLTLREGLTLLEQVYSCPIVSADFVEVNPNLEGCNKERASDICKHLLGAMFGYKRGGL